MFDESLPSMVNLDIADGSFHDLSGNMYSDSFVHAPVSFSTHQKKRATFNTFKVISLNFPLE